VTRSIFAFAAVALLAATSCAGKDSAAKPGTVADGAVANGAVAVACAPRVPEDGPYFGVSIDWEHDSPADYAARLGASPAVYVDFAAFPLEPAGIDHLDRIVSDVSAVHGMLLLTLEPNGGLATVTPGAADDLARRLAGYNERGVPVFVRFAHEMNGSWYPWSQQPERYRQAFQTVATAVHHQAPGSSMLWAPNYGGGYPFAGGPSAAKPGTADFAALDTNHDGKLTMADDAYSPYYPGDDAVDWVGMSLYHWGNQYPWGENEAPEPGKFAAMLTGSYRGANGDETAVPDFYATFAAGHGKPLAITETAAFYAPTAGGTGARAIKEHWWAQVLDPANTQRFPALKMVNWFEWDKYETEVSNRVDWTVTRDPQLAAAFRQAIPANYHFAAQPTCP